MSIKVSFINLSSIDFTGKHKTLAEEGLKTDITYPGDFLAARTGHHCRPSQTDAEDPVMAELMFLAAQDDDGEWIYKVRTTADNVNFAFPGADYATQVQSAQAFANSLRAGQQAGVNWLQTNLNDPMGENVANWAGNLYDEMFSATSELVVNGAIEFTMAEAINEKLVDATATMLSEVIDADADFFGSMLAALLV